MELKPLPKTPTLPSSVGDGKGLIKSLYDHIMNSNSRMNQLITKAQELAASVIAHKETHAIGGSDVLVPSDIGAEPANSNIQTHISSTNNPHGVTAAQVLPTQTGNGGKFLTTDGSAPSWANTGYVIQCLSFTLGTITDAITYYWGNTIPVTTSGVSKLPIPRTGIIKKVYVRWHTGGTAGSNESISVYVRVNGTTDTLIATVGNTSTEKEFYNTGLSIAVSTDDY
ncbi:MAG: hypothetical protein AAGU23_00520, partial [Bacillota bacterium]